MSTPTTLEVYSKNVPAVTFGFFFLPSNNPPLETFLPGELRIAEQGKVKFLPSRVSSCRMDVEIKGLKNVGRGVMVLSFTWRTVAAVFTCRAKMEKAVCGLLPNANAPCLS